MSTFSVKDLPVQRVVVFKDRAEVKRVLKTKLKKGENELVITSISNSIDKDSVRVEGHGNAVVLDVVCQNKRVELSNSTTNDKVKELKSELNSLESTQEINNLRMDKLNRQINVLNEFANSLAKASSVGSPDSQKGSTSLLSSKESIDGFFTFIDTYSNKLDSLNGEKHSLQKEITKLYETIQVVRDNLNRLEYNNYSENIEITILLESSQDDSEVDLLVSYLVYSASWSPKYDIRVFNKDRSMIINYYGLISQSTGEDWNDAKLSLSTAVPSVGGTVPELDTVNIQIKQPIIHRPQPMMKNLGFAGGMSSARGMAMSDNMMMEMSAAPPMAMRSMAMAAPVQVQVAQVQSSSVGSTSTYDIPRTATIPSDNNTHKVSIGILNLKPDFEYASIPKKDAHAFIKAKVINSSEYALLAGPANVFLDNNFVAKTELKSYSPQEEFECSLGVDPALKVDYKPIKKFKAQSGLLTKTTTTTYVQVIELKNTTSGSAKVLLSDTLPLSNDDKIQVKLIEPNLKTATNVKLNKQNNLEFELNILPSKTEEITIKYTIDHPSDKEIEFV